MSIMEHLAQLKPANGSQEEFAELAELARAEGHTMVPPSDVVWKGGKLIGCFAVQYYPIVSAFFSKERTLGRDSVSAINTIEQVLFRTGAKGIYVPVREDSPFHGQMDAALGYLKENNLTYFFKPYV